MPELQQQNTATYTICVDWETRNESRNHILRTISLPIVHDFKDVLYTTIDQLEPTNHISVHVVSADQTETASGYKHEYKYNIVVEFERVDAVGQYITAKELEHALNKGTAKNYMVNA